MKNITQKFIGLLALVFAMSFNVNAQEACISYTPIAQEYMNDARDAGAAAFKVDRIQNHSYAFKSENKFAYLADKNHAIPVNVYIGVDLAATASETSDYQVIMVMAIDSNSNRYVLEYFRERIPTFDARGCRKAPYR